MTDEHGVSVKRACQAARLSRAAYYRPEADRGARDREVIEALNEIVSKELRWGFWKCFDRLRQLGKPWNHKRVHRVYCQMRLNQKRRTKRRLPTRPRQPLLATRIVNAVWALDFMHGTLYSGRTFRTLNVIDEADRGCLGIDLSTSIPANRVIRFVEQLIEIHGMPDQNAFIERFNRPYREEVLNAYLFGSISEVREITDDWLVRYNEIDRTTRWEACHQRATAIACPQRKLHFRTVYLTGKLTPASAACHRCPGSIGLQEPAS